MSDRSLDDFAPDSEADNSEGESDDSTEPIADEPATSATVDSCGETATRRWHDDGRYVCPECKEW